MYGQSKFLGETEGPISLTLRTSIIRPMLPELLSEPLDKPTLTIEYSSSKNTLDREGIKYLIQE